MVAKEQPLCVVETPKTAALSKNDSPPQTQSAVSSSVTTPVHTEPTQSKPEPPPMEENSSTPLSKSTDSVNNNNSTNNNNNNNDDKPNTSITTSATDKSSIFGTEDMDTYLANMIQSLKNQAYPTNKKSISWVDITIKDNILISKRENKDTNIHCFKGVGEIPLAPEKLKDLCLDLSRAKEWDSLLHSAEVIEEIDDHTRVVHLVFQTRMCLIKTARDVCIVYHWVKEKDGTFIIAGKSVKHTNCPEIANCIRAEVLESGYVIQPKRGDPNSSIVTYLSQVDLKNIPPTILAIVGEKQPMIIAGIRKAVTGK